MPSLTSIFHASRLSSLSANYGSGSGQQVITTKQAKVDDAGSLWIVRDAERTDKTCYTGAAIKCGDKLRLEHN